MDGSHVRSWRILRVAGRTATGQLSLYILLSRSLEFFFVDMIDTRWKAVRNIPSLDTNSERPLRGCGCLQRTVLLLDDC